MQVGRVVETISLLAESMYALDGRYENPILSIRNYVDSKGLAASQAAQLAS
jgi:hypothetical protein